MSSNLQLEIELLCPLEKSTAIAPPYSIEDVLLKKSQLVMVNYEIKYKFKAPEEYTSPVLNSKLESDISSKGMF